ncbi:Uncharacterized HTH-type transcriptional regulator yjiR [Serratia fonticola]|uniref:Uncharacterized HTH-type transcriptional regulator yjiR n=1 Tax=Serratia fonticola TaxID=47917 RepID=A0A4U9WNX1_SERFO|nr:Uncharacterized HTH-type transcriptional regulator yjiR [Serratia fonticola]
MANILSQRIKEGLYVPGERLPSVRVLSDEHGVSISTVQQAYRQLEECLLIESRPKSGYFVRCSSNLPALPALCSHAQRPVEISQWENTLEFLRGSTQKNVLHLGVGTPDLSGPGLKILNRLLARISLHQSEEVLDYDSIYGTTTLREQIARLMLDSGNHQSADKYHYYLWLPWRTGYCARGRLPAWRHCGGGFPQLSCAMQTLKGMGMKVIEIPTDPGGGDQPGSVGNGAGSVAD